jgi:MoxR-like ATPase
MTQRLNEKQRNALRSLVRAQAGYDAWREAKGYGPHLTKAWIFEAIYEFCLEAEARELIAANLDMSTSNESSDESGENNDRVVVDTLGDMDSSNGESSAIDVDMDKVLSPVRPFLAGALVQQMESALRPIVEAAHKPATIVEKTASTPLREGEAPRASRVGASTMAKLFSVPGANGKKPVALWNDPCADKPDASYVMDGKRMYTAVSLFERGEIAWLAGSAGTGKTTLAREYAARTGRGFVRIGFNRTTELIDLLGQKEPTPAGEHGAVRMVWTDGVFTQAIRRPGTVVLFDELTGAPPGTAMAFQVILDNKRVTLPTGEVVAFADGVVVVIADNTAGYGDESGVYAGTHSANAALVDRAARVILVDYLPAMLEAEALQRHSGAPQAACIRLADFAAKVRTLQAQTGGDVRPLSIRRLIAFANATHRDGLAFGEALSTTMLSRLPEADREALRQAVNAHLDERAYKCELSGVIPPFPADIAAVVASSPQQNAARDAFDAGANQV